MNNRYSANSKLCATCTYWMGQRSCNQTCTWIENCASEGRCVVSPNIIRTRQANTCACNEWEKWAVLK